MISIQNRLLHVISCHPTQCIKQKKVCILTPYIFYHPAKLLRPTTTGSSRRPSNSERCENAALVLTRVFCTKCHGCLKVVITSSLLLAFPSSPCLLSTLHRFLSFSRFLTPLLSGNPPINRILVKSPYPSNPNSRYPALSGILANGDFVEPEIGGQFLGCHDFCHGGILQGNRVAYYRSWMWMHILYKYAPRSRKSTKNNRNERKFHRNEVKDLENLNPFI